MKNVILEDIDNMKYLLGYKRGIVVSEQESVPSTPPQQLENPETIKIGVFNPRVQVLQELLNKKFQSGLVPDGKYGPKTANAIYKNILSINKTQVNNVNTGITPSGVNQQSNAQPTSTLPNLQQ